MLQLPRIRALSAATLLIACGGSGGDDASAAGGSDGSGAGSSSATGSPSSTGSGGDGAGGAGGASSGGGGSGAGCPAPPDGLPSGPLTRFDGNPLLNNGPEAYDFWKTGPRVVLKEGPATYKLWYEAVADATYTTVGYATSTDGLEWSKQGPVLAPSASWEGNEVSPNSLLVEGGQYVLYYHAGGSQLTNRRIGRATSSDGLAWSKLPDPLLDLGAPGQFDDEQVAEPRVFHIGSEYRMYYTGRASASGQTSLGMATSPDGVVWTKHPDNPILTGSSWGNFWGGAFFYENGIWHLWHGVTDGAQSGLHYKWSTDGISWNDGPSNPVLTQNPDMLAADAGLVGDSVSGYRDGADYRILYTGFNWNLFGTDGRFEGICMASVMSPCP